MSNAQLSAQILSEDFPSFDLSFKIIIVGDSGVGKSCLSIKASRNFFEDFYSPTVGFEFLTFNVKVEDKNIKLQIWDTCGQEVYRSLISSFYRSASLAVIVYSIDSEESFKSIEKWLNDIKTQSNPDVKIFLIGNKADLEDKREVTKESGEKFAKEHNISFFTETSAKTGFNVQNVFIEVAKELYRQHEEVKNRVSRPGSMAAVPYTPEITNNVSLETGEDDEDKKLRKKGCC
jgi:small GTP-binding protein